MQATLTDPAERHAVLRWFYRGWRPTRLGRSVNRVQGWWSSLGLPPGFMATLEVRGRKSGRRRSTPVVITTVEGRRYLVSMLGPGSDWVKNVEAQGGNAVLRHGRRRRVQLTRVPSEERAPILREYVRIAPSGRQHFPLAVGAPLSEFEAIADRYPVYRIDPSEAEIRALLDRRSEAIGNRDLDRLMSLYASDIVYFDLVPPLQYAGSAALRDRFADWFPRWRSRIGQQLQDVTITMGEDIAAAHMLIRTSGTLKDGQEVGYWVRTSNSFRRSGNRWLITHEHVSLPVDMQTRAAVMDLEP
jgi:deazaflavin-dependent oxidoreductase (nitroreductase family)